ncbi:hypothetical protein ACS0TY_029811 [Phlomoides rotata]
MLDLFWEHPPALDPEVVGRMMQSIRDRIRGLEDRRRALLNEEKEFIVRAATLVLLNRLEPPNPSNLGIGIRVENWKLGDEFDESGRSTK